MQTVKKIIFIAKKKFSVTITVSINLFNCIVSALRAAKELIERLKTEFTTEKNIIKELDTIFVSIFRLFFLQFRQYNRDLYIFIVIILCLQYITILANINRLKSYC